MGCLCSHTLPALADMSIYQSDIILLSLNGCLLLTVVPSGAIQITSDGTSVAQGLQTLTMTNASPTTSAATGATIVQYAQGPDGQFYIPGMYTGTLFSYNFFLVNVVSLVNCHIQTSGSCGQFVDLFWLQLYMLHISISSQYFSK